MKPDKPVPISYAVMNFKVIAWGYGFIECSERAIAASGWDKAPGSVAPYWITSSFIGLPTYKFEEKEKS